jgi:hypothetical protein
MKILKKYWTRVVGLVLIVLILIYVPCFALKSARDYEIYKEPQLNTRVYSLYHIETFEGGSKSRSQFLNTVARALEKDHAGNLFMIKTIKPEELQSILSQQTPDLISFGHGVGHLALPYLIDKSETYDIRDSLLFSGIFNNKIYAYPYIASGYAYFTHGVKTDDYWVGSSIFVHPENSYDSINQKPVKDISSYEAYKKFVYNKKSNLLGTSRDLFRVENLNNIGRLNASITPLETYTDLIQYIGTTNNDSLCQKFISMCVSREYQAKLTEYSLFSVLNHKLYSSGIYNDMENAIFKCNVARVFQ